MTCRGFSYLISTLRGTHPHRHCAAKLGFFGVQPQIQIDGRQRKPARALEKHARIRWLRQPPPELERREWCLEQSGDRKFVANPRATGSSVIGIVLGADALVKIETFGGCRGWQQAHPNDSEQ